VGRWVGGWVRVWGMNPLCTSIGRSLASNYSHSLQHKEAAACPPPTPRLARRTPFCHTSTSCLRSLGQTVPRAKRRWAPFPPVLPTRLCFCLAVLFGVPRSMSPHPAPLHLHLTTQGDAAAGEDALAAGHWWAGVSERGEWASGRGACKTWGAFVLLPCAALPVHTAAPPACVVCANRMFLL